MLRSQRLLQRNPLLGWYSMLVERWYQTAAREAAWLHLCHQHGSPVIVSPTGSGKSIVIAALCRDAVELWRGRVIVLHHRKELIGQNSEKIRLLSGQDCGIYSAGLKSRHTEHDVVCAGIQSCFRRAHEFGARHLVVIDEAHLVGPDGEGMYQKFLADLKKYNPQLRMIGLTATPFRTATGPLCSGDGLFQKVCFTVPVSRLIHEGFLCRITNQPAATSFDTSKLHVRAGEFVSSEVESLFGTDDAVDEACREVVATTQDRHSVLVFCSGVRHTERVAATLERMSGQPVGYVIGDMLAIERAETLRRFKAGELKYLCNCDVLTTGFDSPNIDAIAVLRATMSPGLFAQMVGRGFRVDPSKTDCAVIDFGNNISRHGPLDNENYGLKTKQQRETEGNPGGPGQKECPNCHEWVAANTRECVCGFIFPPTHDANADSKSALLAADVVATDWIVESVTMHRHKKRKPDGRPDTLCVTYTCQPAYSTGGNITRKDICEWVCIEHDGYARTKASQWWRARSIAPVPSDIDEAIELWQRGAVATSSAISTKPDGHFLRIVKHELDEKPETWDEEVSTFDFTGEEAVPF